MEFVLPQIPLVRGQAPNTPSSTEVGGGQGYMNGLRPPLTTSHLCAFLLLRAARPQSGLPPSLEMRLNLRRKNVPQIEVYFDMTLVAE